MIENENFDTTEPSLPEAEYFTLKEFKFNNGAILKDAKVEYITLGTPKYDEEGLISNAVVYFHGSGVNYSCIDMDKSVGPGRIYDTDKLFIIVPTALGHPGSSSPSTTGLKGDFPEYDISDMVNFSYQFIQEKFGLTKIKGLIGVSMGGFEVLSWASMYPNSIDFAISNVSSHKTGGHNYATTYFITTILESDPDYNNGFYQTPISKSLKRSMKLASYAEFSYLFSREFYRFALTNQELKDTMNQSAEESLENDVNDTLYINKSFLNYDITEDIEKITAKILILAIDQDQFFPPNLDAIPLSKLIKNNKLITFDSNMGHIGAFDLESVEDDVREFLKEFI
ncbi:MAG: alpha/beta fold hydrolase [Methanobacteriaceae archaeon]|nr:alpha/beta fold hydrolase [Methanobacteriaceae archaeon]